MRLVKKSAAKIASDGFVELFRSTAQYSRRRVKRLLLKIKRLPLYLRLKNQLFHRLDGYTAVPDPFKTVHVNPAKIESYSSEFGKWESVGEIRGGDWDKQASHLNEMVKFQAVKDHFCNDVPWEETGVIDHLLNRLSKEGRSTIDGCRDRAEIKERYNQIDQLYQSMKESGYQEEEHSPTDYIAVHIGRHGEFLFAGSGNHRLAIAKILGFDEIPIWVRARHEEWQELRDDVYNNGLSEEHGEEIRNHPDLQEILD